MTLMEFTGCALTAFGPALSMFIVTIMNDPVRVIILIASSFFWLLSLLLSSIVWFVFPSKQQVWFGVLVSVLVQELFRYFLYLLLRKSERGLKRFVVHSLVSNNKHMLSYVSGLGFGVMSGLFSLINILAEVGGPGTMGLRGGYSAFCIVSSIFTGFTILLHIFWGIIFFHGLNTDNKNLILYVIISHLVVSEVTLLNQYYYNTLALSIVFIITVGSGCYAFKTAGGQLPLIDKLKNQNTTEAEAECPDRCMYYIICPAEKTMPELDQQKQQCLVAMETLDRSSPELWPEPMPGMSGFAQHIRASSATDKQPSWKQPPDAHDMLLVQRYSQMPLPPLLDELKSLYDFAYNLGLEESKEMTRGKYLNIFTRNTNKASE